MTDFNDIIQNANANSRRASRHIGGVLKKRNELDKLAFEDGALTTKTKELIAVAFAISEKCEPCIGYHMERLIKLDVTQEEVAELVNVAIIMNGGPGMVYANKALEAYEQLSKA